MKLNAKEQISPLGNKQTQNKEKHMTKQELIEWNTGEVCLWLQNEEHLYFGSKKLKTSGGLARFWRLNKPRDAKTNSKYVNWKEVLKTIKEE
jgi:hypothetical protein